MFGAVMPFVYSFRTLSKSALIAFESDDALTLKSRCPTYAAAAELG